MFVGIRVQMNEVLNLNFASIVTYLSRKKQFIGNNPFEKLPRTRYYPNNLFKFCHLIF